MHTPSQTNPSTNDISPDPGNRNGTPSIDMVAVLNALSALKKGDFSVRLPVEWTGIAGRVSDTFNDVIALNERMASELSRVAKVVGKEGRLDQRATLGDVSGSWSASIACIN